MKLNPRDIATYVAKPDATKSAVLFFGQDPMRIALRRQTLIKALLGKNAEEEMRLTRMPAAELHKEKSLLVDATKAIGFFPGPRAVLVEDANDNTLRAIELALDDWATGDAQIIVVAGNLTAKSKLRKLFEGAGNAYAIPIYDDPPSRAEIDAALNAAGLNITQLDARDAIAAFAQTMDPGDFQQFIEKLGLYAMDTNGDVSIDDIEAVAPASTEAALDELVNAVADAQAGTIGPLSNRITAQGTSPTAVCIAMQRHFKTLFAASAHPGGAAQGWAGMKPPVFGPRRARMQKQAQNWGRPKLEQAVSLLLDVDLKLRSAGQTAPQMAMVQRYLIRIAMMGRR